MSEGQKNARLKEPRKDPPKEDGGVCTKDLVHGHFLIFFPGCQLCFLVNTLTHEI